ncbi:MAG TPA: thioredoxin family protein [Thermoanaerobaculia bacterium]|nr:thioredoxin family protein [Thermoanaerobaculia bacterium]
MDKIDAVPARVGPQASFPAILLGLLAAAVLLRIVAGFTAPKGPSDSGLGLVKWQQLESTASQAGRQGKAILYDFTAAWCAPCHILDQEGWGDQRIAAIVTDHFVAARVIDREREDGKNTPLVDELQKRYAVRAFPTLIAADASGREIARMEGYGGRDRLVKFLEDAGKK